MDPSGRDSRYNLNYSMSIGLSMGENPDIYGQTNPSLVRPPSGLSQSMNRGGSGSLMGTNAQCGSMSNSRGIKRTSSDCYDDRSGIGSQSLSQLEGCQGGVPDVVDDSYTTLQKKSPPANGKKTKGRVKIKMEYIDNKLRRYTTFSKRKTGIMKKAYELSTLTGTQVMLLVASETGHVYTFATRKLQPMITSEAGKQLIQTCLNSPDPPSGALTGDQRMSATGFEETELSYNIGDDDSKDDRSPLSSGESSDESSSVEVAGPSHHIQEQIGRRQRHPPHQSTPVTKKQESPQQQSQQIQVRDELGKAFANNSNLNSLLYPQALVSLPQEVLMNLVQSGHLQVGEEENGRQFISIPQMSSNSSEGGGTSSGSSSNRNSNHNNSKKSGT
ncbi:serum response factor homolog [Contarinia nasturtii]|uniref:serum response factor homolog n=1 Tax=Contarinia nasturtii TaxID=265458 RepID=UPI0012D3EE4F|nr:serum response factor homolog [Contarinia nasturtii]XP_031640954.1 serum response factor homolog [Contarinia nasturtii]XP_031640955.1 serum response factor homolog [Contarinia nasturtii]XP_031640956.1 serum response factor homolog [Contarinia nasturtii]